MWFLSVNKEHFDSFVFIILEQITRVILNLKNVYRYKDEVQSKQG